jgi:carbamoyltransferase
MSVILGLNAGHPDSAACLVVDGKLVGAVAEERLGERYKHSPEFPENAVRWLLADNGLKLEDVTHVTMARDSSANRAAKVSYVVRNPVSGISSAIEHFGKRKKSASLVEILAAACGEDVAAQSFATVPVEHHLAHISSAYYVSPFESLTAGFSYDASGDFCSGMAARCEGTSITPIGKALLPDSMGFFYTAMCQFIGFERFGEEYKVMGLAPYGEDKYADAMKQMVQLTDDGWFRLMPGYFGMHDPSRKDRTDAGPDERIVVARHYEDKMAELFGPARRREDPLGQREMDIARSAQVRFEEVALHCLNALHKQVPTGQLVMAGGCALNGVANARILRETPFTTPYLQAAASDDGACLGAAYHVWHQVEGRKERYHMEHAAWGPGYSDDRIRKVAEAAGYPLTVCADEDELVEVASGLIAEGLVMGWYQGRSEWGPRALGNRSILANPAILTMKDTINAKIKRRESFRPFAPSVLREDVAVYFEQEVYSPFMMHVVKLKPEWHGRLPAITHVDGTGRLQSVDPASNALYHKLITAFKKRTGIGMVLNTSFNENEPVVDTPEQALACFARTEMDALCLGRYVLRKA